MTTSRNINSVNDLVGEEVDAVCFVSDYLELRFAGPVLRCLLYPVRVQRQGNQAEFPQAGSRDSLCSLIGSAVAQVDVTEAALVIHFSDQATIAARIDEADARGPESIQFVPWENGRLNVAAMETW